MVITILNRQYPVEVAERDLVRDGKRVNALFQRAQQRFLISPALPETERYKALVHECRHAWTDLFGLPAGGESDAEDVSTFMDAIAEQIDAQGGRGALLRLRPRAAGFKSPTSFGGAAIVSRHECRICGASTMSGSVKQGEPQLHPTYGEFFVDREFDCEACGSVNRWAEFCTEKGHPLGQPVPGVEYQAI